MKKNLLILGTMLVTTPVWAVCSITGGACSPTLGGVAPLEERLVPHDLDTLIAPPQLPPVAEVDDLRYYTDDQVTNTLPYDANNQFGQKIDK